MRLFLLSPASTSGRRAAQLLNEAARFDLALKIRETGGAPIGDVFSFLSALYFRGKLAYARHFAATRHDLLVITSDRGLVSPDQPVGITDLLAMAANKIDLAHAEYREALERDAQLVRNRIAPDTEVVLLGSIATAKYVDVLTAAFGDRLKFPVEFVGCGDMSRGGILLRAVREDRELAYASVLGATRTGKRPAKLERIK